MLSKNLVTKIGIPAFLGIIAHIGTAAALPLTSGCGNELDPLPGIYEDTFNVDGNTIGGDLNRRYIVNVPNDYDHAIPTPLVFLFHGMNSWPIQGSGGAIQTNWQDPETPTPIVVMPRSLTLDQADLEDSDLTEEELTGDRLWNLNLEWSDVELIDALKRHMITNYCIDEDRIFTTGSSSGGFAALGTGCHAHMSALVAERGAILHPQHAVDNWGFPLLTPEPADEACGPVPILYGFANQDQAYGYTTDTPLDHFIFYRDPTVDFFVANNNCDVTYQPDNVATAEICDVNEWENNPNCECHRYDNCMKDLLVCTWDGDHGNWAFGADDTAWFFNQVGANSNVPQCYHESFDGGGSSYQWDIRRRRDFNAYFHAGKERLHVNVPRNSRLLLGDSYTPGAYARFDEHAWDVPLLKDFSVSLTVTNLKYDFPEVRLKVFAADAVAGFDAPLVPVPMMEIRTSFDTDGNLSAQAYNDGQPAGTAWSITRSGPGGTRLWDGACWMMRGDPISDEVIVYSRNIDSTDWPNCSGDWVEQARFINPYFTNMEFDYNITPAEVHIEAGRNNSLTTAIKDGYVRFDNVDVGRRDCGAGELSAGS